MIDPVYAIIDLTDGKVTPYHISPEDFQKYLGGKTMGIKLLTELTEAGTDPLSPQSVIIINTGPLNGTGSPSSSRFNMTFKNVMTGGIGTSNCGGNFGFMMKRAGYDGIILKGRAPEHSTINITDSEITITSADDIWGLDTEKAQEKLPKNYGKLVIGPAGENLVRYAAAVSGERVAGRCGAGAVLGSKNIKAIVAYGTKLPEIYNKEKFDKWVKTWVKFIKGHPMTGSGLPGFGTAGLVSNADASSALPTKNFRYGQYKEAEKISGIELSEKYLTRNSGCISCPIRCERRVKLGDKEVKGPEYETVGLFGSNIGNDDLGLINEFNYKADILGMDTISLAVTISFAMELQEKGRADFGLKFGVTENLDEAIEKIARREGKLGELADGSKILSQRYGGEDFAIHAKGMELAAYEPRESVGMGLGYATSNRGGCHLNGGYLALMESVGVINMDNHTVKGKPELTIFFQNTMEAISASGSCLFTAQTIVPAFLYNKGPVSKWNTLAGKAMLMARGAMRILINHPGLLPIKSKYLLPHCRALEYATGMKMNAGRLIKIGERGYNAERMYNLREGLTMADDSLPARLTDDPQKLGDDKSRVRLDKMLPVYYKVRGWDRNGIPKEKKLKKLGLEPDLQ